MCCYGSMRGSLALVDLCLFVCCAMFMRDVRCVRVCLMRVGLCDVNVWLRVSYVWCLRCDCVCVLDACVGLLFECARVVYVLCYVRVLPMCVCVLCAY